MLLIFCKNLNVLEIFLQKEKTLKLEKKLINLPLDTWDEGWSFYIDPYKIKKHEYEKYLKIENLDIEDLTKKYDSAIEKEDYEKAKVFKEKITLYNKYKNK